MTKGTKVFLTGADGLLGSNLCREMRMRSYRITALVEKGRSHSTIEGIEGLELLEGDILDADGLKEQLRGHDYLIHAAAHTGIQPARNPAVVQVNVEGTRNLIKAALETDIKRSIFVGTANTFAPGTKSNPGNESGGYGGAKYGTDYMDSKYQAYLDVKQAVKNDGLNAITVHPTFMLGPYDSKPSSGAMIMALCQGKVPGYTAGGRNYICVKDAAIGVVNAIEQGVSGESYIIGGQNLNYKEAFALMAETIGVKAPALPFPSFVVKLYGEWNHLKEKLSGKPAKISKAMAQISLDEHYYSAEKAIRELSLPQTPIEEGIKECFEWMKENTTLL